MNGPTITRRQLLKGACAAYAATMTARLWTPGAAFAAEGKADHTLVTLFLRGGMDGLSAVVPVNDARYHALRPTIAVPGATDWMLDDAFGLHPALAPLHELRDMLAVVPAAGQPDPTRSHFDAMHHVESGFTNDGTGWLTRHVHSAGLTAAPLHAIGWGAAPPASLLGHSGALSMDSLNSFNVDTAGNVREPLMAALRDLYGSDDPLSQGARRTFRAMDEVAHVRETGPEPIVDYPTSHLGRSLADIARTIKAEVGLVAATVDVGGWDTHDRMGSQDGGRMFQLLDDLGRSLGSFASDLGARFDDVTLVVMSEFGRPLAENGSGGLDHGRGNAMLVLGGGVTGGVYGDWLGLEDDVLDTGDVPTVNDYRHVLGEVVSGRAGNPHVDQVFPDFTAEPFGFVPPVVEPVAVGSDEWHMA